MAATGQLMCFFNKFCSAFNLTISGLRNTNKTLDITIKDMASNASRIRATYATSAADTIVSVFRNPGTGLAR